MLYFVVIFVFWTVPCTGLHLLYLSFPVCGKLIIIIIKEGTCLTRDKCQLSAHVILYVEPTITSVQNDTNAMLYCKVIARYYTCSFVL